MDDSIFEQAEIEVKYAGYIEKEKRNLLNECNNDILVVKNIIKNETIYEYVMFHC